MTAVIEVTCFTICLSQLFTRTFCTECTDYQLTPLPDFDDKYVNQNLVWENQVLIGVECVGKCFFDHRCHSVQIDRNTGGCTGHATAFANHTKVYPPPTSRLGSRLYLLPRASHYIGSGCTNDVDCHVATSVCNDGVCTCQIGYWFSPSQKACVTECTTLGPGLVRYAGHAIWGNDLEDLTSIEDSQCQQLCINITCSSVDYDPPGKRCFLSSATYLSVGSGSRGVHAGWVHYQRNCAS
ncbi:uncharacterized protein LOC124118731 isoform X1 [Haliotis rufescens]|uniref:uncharacterized protein LOC124118731 isoform X1 n=1 Tax=Haliotis rufescens TaxID=6454 RepID=UPI00201E940F|nr:uncharacterized protein LOC124118731 isoform X1 [Haliotis rufescens]